MTNFKIILGLVIFCFFLSACDAKGNNLRFCEIDGDLTLNGLCLIYNEINKL
jgi:hypothetical protein